MNKVHSCAGRCGRWPMPSCPVFPSRGTSRGSAGTGWLVAGQCPRPSTAALDDWRAGVAIVKRGRYLMPILA